MLQTILFGLWDSVKYWQFWITAWISVSMVLAPAADDDDAAADRSAVYAPYVVAVLKKSRLSCTGFLLSIQYVGIGCHCIADMPFPTLNMSGRPHLNGMKLKDYDFVAGANASDKFLDKTAHTRKPRALLTHPYCENEPPPVYDIGIAVMEEPFPTIQDKIEVYDLFRTDAVEFVRSLTEMFSWTNPKDAPSCTYAGWKISNKLGKGELIKAEMINLPTVKCRNLWRQEDPDLVPQGFNFSRPEQFCLVTRNETEDDIDLPEEGPVVCKGLYVGYVIYGSERRQRTRRVPIITQSLAVILDWMKADPYFVSIGCFGNDSNCGDEDEDTDKQSAAVKNTMGLSIIMLLLLWYYRYRNYVHTSSLHEN